MFFKLSVRQTLRATFCSPTSLVTPLARVMFAFDAVAKAITRGRTSVPVLCRCLDIDGLKLNLNPCTVIQAGYTLIGDPRRVLLLSFFG